MRPKQNQMKAWHMVIYLILFDIVSDKCCKLCANSNIIIDCRNPMDSVAAPGRFLVRLEIKLSHC
jgi:hypothetical protein